MSHPFLLLLSLAVALHADALRGDARSDYHDLDREYQAALAEFSAEQAQIEEEHGTEAAQDYAASWHPAGHFTELFRDKAALHAGTEGAVPFLLWLVTNAPGAGVDPIGPASRRSIEALVERHASSPDLARFLENAPYFAFQVGQRRADAVLDALVTAARDPAFRLRAKHARARSRLEASTPESIALARAELAEIKELAAGTSFATDVERWLFELERLQVGCVAPDIQGVDVQGTPFRLSDYRGRVVLLDFWGDW